MEFHIKKLENSNTKKVIVLDRPAKYAIIGVYENSIIRTLDDCFAGQGTEYIDNLMDDVFLNMLCDRAIAAFESHVAMSEENDYRPVLGIIVNGDKVHIATEHTMDVWDNACDLYSLIFDNVDTVYFQSISRYSNYQSFQNNLVNYYSLVLFKK